MPSYIKKACIILVIYLFAAPLAFMFNVVYFNEARNESKKSGQHVPGYEFLGVLMALGSLAAAGWLATVVARIFFG